jgi:hypothetical protein
MAQSYPGHIPSESITRKFCVNCLSSGVIEHVKIRSHAYAGIKHVQINKLPNRIKMLQYTRLS